MSNNYTFGKYANIERWSSYWHQIDEVLKLDPGRVLEIGVGDGVLRDYLKSHFSDKIFYQCLDVASDLAPDVVGSVEDMPFEDESFDVACAFEVLEHLPYGNFLPALKELRRVAKDRVVLSLPHWSRHFSVDMRLPFFKRIRWQYKCNLFPIVHKFDGEHYWEIGKSGYPLIKIKKQLESAGFEIVNEFVPIESPYHHFFILKKISHENNA